MKRIYSLLMAVAIVICSLGISVSAKAEISKYDVAENRLMSLGICDGINSDVQSDITRAEFVAMVVRTLNYTDNIKVSTTFADCTGSKFASEIQCAYDLGITSGTSESTFSPDSPVSVDAAAKMIVSALGYAVKAEAQGGYPTGYMHVANSLGIFDSTSISGSVKVEDAYIMVSNMLLADVPEFTGVKYRDEITQTSKGSNLLIQRFGLEKTEGIVTTAGYYAVNTEFVGNGDIEINGECYKTDADVEELLGYNTELWYDPDDNRAYVISPKTLNKTVELNIEDIEDFASNTITVYNEENNKSYKYTLGTDYTCILNGRVAELDKSLFENCDGSVTLIDNDNDGSYEYVIVKRIEYFVISAIDIASDTIYDSDSNIKSIYFPLDTRYSYKVEINGEKAEFDDLELNMVCLVYMSEDSEVCRIYATDKKIVGVISEISDNEYVIDGKVYKAASYFDGLGIKLNIGSEYEFLLADDDTIVSISGVPSSKYSYGYFLDYKAKDGVSSSVAVKLLTSQNDISIYELSDKVFVDGVKYNKNSSYIESLFIHSTTANNYIPNYQVIRYRVSDNKITHIDTAEYITDPIERWNVDEYKDEDDFLTIYVDKQNVNFRQNTGFGAPNVPMRNAVIFEVPLSLATDTEAKYDDDLFRVTGTGSMVNNVDYTVDAYDYNSNYVPGVVVWYNSTDGISTPSKTTAVGLVTSLNKAIDLEGNPSYLIRIYGGGTYQKYYMKEKTYDKLVYYDMLPGSGDIVRLSIDVTGYVTGLSRDVDYNEETGKVTVNYSSDAADTSYKYEHTYFTGTVVVNSTSYMTLAVENAPADLSQKYATLPLNSPRYVIYDKKSGEVYAGTSASIISSAGGGAKPSYVVCKSNYYNIDTVFIYVE